MNADRWNVPWRGGEVSTIRRAGPRPIVLLHGLCGGAVHFDQAFEAPGLQGRGLVAVDLPGFGESRVATPDDAALDAQAEACRAVFAALGPDVRPALVAHSMAGSVASRLLADIAGLVLLEGNIVADNLEFSDRILRTPEHDFPAEYARMQRTADMIIRMLTSVGDRARRAAYAATYRACEAAVVRRVAAETNRDTRSGDPVRRLADWGRRFHYYVAGDGDLDPAGIARSGLNVAIRTIPDARHFLMLDNPAETYRALAADLA